MEDEEFQHTTSIHVHLLMWEKTKIYFSGMDVFIEYFKMMFGSNVKWHSFIVY